MQANANQPHHTQTDTGNALKQARGSGGRGWGRWGARCHAGRLHQRSSSLPGHCCCCSGWGFSDERRGLYKVLLLLHIKILIAVANTHTSYEKEQ